MGDSKKKKVTVLGLSSILLVAMVVGVVVGIKKANEGGDATSSGGDQVSTSNKAVTAMCQSTDYKQTCEDSLASAQNTSDPKDLIKTAFDYTVKKIESAVKNSTLLQEAAKDPRTSEAFQTCKEVLNDSIDDLKRSFNKVGDLEWSKLNDYVEDVKTWLSATVTYHETCLDAFENTTGDSGEKMKKLLKTSGELTSNALAMMEQVSSATKSLDLSFLNKRRLLQESSHDDYLPYPMKEEISETTGRRLFQETSHDDYLPYPMKEEISETTGRRLFQETSHDDYLPYPPMKETGRRLFQESSNDDYKPYPSSEKDGATGRRLLEAPSWVDAGRRALLQADPKTLKPSAVVTKEGGSGTFKTIQDAINAVPKNSNHTFVILIKEGVYKEYVEIPRHVNNIVLLGEGPSKTKITGNKNYIDGIGTYKTATVAVQGENFIARDIGFENSAGPMKHQAVALRVSADRAIFYNCQMDGYQDTLYTHSYRQYYRECNITGTIDFIFGDAAAVFQKCNMIVRKPLDNQACMVTAQGRKDHRSVGAIILQGCTITADPTFMATDPRPVSYLGRPWKEYSRTIIMQSYIDSNIAPEGWSPWAGTFALDTLYYSEFNNKGPGSDVAKRVNWKGIKKISPQEAESYTPGKFIQGDMWIKPTGIPYDSGMMKV